MAEIQNSNPTIRSASDLPTRQQRTSSPSTKNDPLGLFASTIPSSTYLVDPFEPAPITDSDSEDDAVEPIDEQEIYGTVPLLSFNPSTQSD